MKFNWQRSAFLLAIIAATGGTLIAQETSWTGAADSDFANPANWSDGVPGTFDDLAIIEGGANLPVQVAADIGTVQVGAIQIGAEASGGELVQNGGTFIINGDDLGEESAVGILAQAPTRWVLNNDATVLYDLPLSGNGNGLGSDGTGKDFDVGKSVPEGAEGILELHDNAVFRISDDLKVADGDGGHGIVIMDGNSRMTVGSGISASGVSQFSISGNALLVTGNSSDPGDDQNGLTNEGYLTLSTDAAGEATITLRENGKIYARTLQQRNGISTIDLADNAEFHVFEVFEYSEPNPGSATVIGSGQESQRTSHLSQDPTAESYVRLAGSSRMTFDTALEDSAWSGLAISGGNNRGGGSEGGLTEIEILEQATFIVAQDLNMTLGIGETAESTLRVIGPDATVTIGGDLRMALDEFGEETPGEATIEAVLTGPSHSTINVAGTALIANGNLAVRFDGYTPNGGEAYDLLNAGSIDSTAFADTVLPTLPDGLSWDLSIGADSVRLTILGGTAGDFDGNGILDAADIDVLTAAVRDNSTDARFDLNGDSVVNDADRTVWVDELRRTYFGDANLDGEFNSGDLVSVFTVGEYEDMVEGNSTWADGDWDGNGDFDSSDFVKAFSAGGYEQGPRAAVASVPEPTSCGVLLLGAAIAMALGRRR